MNKLLIAASMLAALVVATPNRASAAVLFDPDDGGGDASFQLGVFDWGVSSAIGVGASEPSVGTDFQLSTHASLATFNNSAALTSTTGLGSAYEYTFVSSFTERVISLTDVPPVGQTPGDSAVFGISPVQGPNFFEVYYDPTPDANDLAGTGFNDGILVLSGNVTDSFGSFTLAPPTPTTVDLDQFVTTPNNYPLVDTITGGGFTDLFVSIAPAFVNPAFFTGTPPASLSFHTLVNLPFREVDPSASFYFTPGGGAPLLVGASTLSTGPVNGSGAGNDLMLQVDANASINAAAVPEPATCFAFAAIAASGLGFSRRRRA